ncbi:MAG: alkaline phosphatase family protein, partial [Anaerolineae bacterium]|nr:alkaline phosphatase family protein [Anaerolineae bacterium]
LPLWTPNPQPTPTLSYQPRQTVFILSWVGAQDEEVDLYRRRGLLPHLDELAQKGVEADHLAAPFPAQIVPAHAVLASGATSNRLGLVGERFHLPGTSIDEIVDVRTQAPYAVEPIWRRAMRRGMRTAVICWPGISTQAANMRASYTIADGRTVLPAAKEVISLTKAIPWDGAPPSYAPYLEGEITEPSNNTTLGYVLAIDSHDDGRPSYDLFIFNHTRRVDKEALAVRAGEWIPWHYTSFAGPAGGWLLIIDPSPATFTLYQSEMRNTLAYPLELRTLLEAELGPPPPPPDRRALEWGWINIYQYLEMLRRRVLWIEKAAALVQEHFAPDLILVAQDAPSLVHQALWLHKERQMGYTVEKATTYAIALEESYRLLDASLGRLLAQLDPQKSTLFLVSPNGQAPVHTLFYPNTLLEKEGWLKLAENPEIRPRLLITQTQALAVASGGLVHIYLNIEQRERQGIVASSQVLSLTNQIAQTFTTITDTTTGEKIVASVITKTTDLLPEGVALAGDIVVHLQPGYLASDALGEKEMLTPTDVRASDGFWPTERAMQGIFYAFGRGVHQRETLGTIDARSLAPTVARLLGFNLQEGASGTPLDSLFPQSETLSSGR